MDRILRTLLLAFLATLLVACGGSAGGTKRTDAMTEYGAAVRWSEFDEAWTFLSPFYRMEHPLTDLERERYKQLQVTGYEVRIREISPDGLRLEQVVDIRVVNRHTQVEKMVTDRQLWTYDAEAKKWWLESGLPDLSEH